MGITDLFRKKKDLSGHFSNKSTRSPGGPLLHLRLDSEGRGILMINGSRVIRLNETAGLYVKHALLGTPEAKTVALVRRRYAASKALAKRDLAQVTKALERLAKNPDEDPFDAFRLDDGDAAGPLPLESPLHMYVYTTYEDPDSPVVDPVPPGRTKGVMSRREWEVLFERLDGIGVQYVTFAGGEPTSREDLPVHIAKASGLGMAVGLETNGARLADTAYLDMLVRSGLDGVAFKFPASDPKEFKKLHDTKRKGFYKDCVQGMRNALSAGLPVQASIILSRQTLPHLENTVKFLADLKVPIVALSLLPQSNPDLFLSSAIPKEHLGSILNLVNSLDGRGTRVVLRTPVGGTQADGGTLRQVVDCTGAYTNMALEPNADVLVCRYIFKPIGNLLADPWPIVWNNPVAVKIRERQELPQRCGSCPDLVLCGGGCPQTVFFNEQAIERDFVMVEEDRKR